MESESAPFALIQRLAAQPGVELHEHEPLARHTSMGVGGPARWLVTAHDDAALDAVLTTLTAGAVPWMLLGGGSNTIFTEAGYPGVVLMLGRGFKALEAGSSDHSITAGAGAPLSAVMNFAKRAGLAGLEFAAGIPGTLGGALAGNAGTRAGEVCALAGRVWVIDTQGRRQVRTKGSFAYGYRTSELRRDVILRAELELCPDERESIQARIDATLAKRGEQPVGVRCSGCMFRNPEGDFAGRLIEQAGLKGLRVGGAYVSEKHANFMINDGTATADDLCRLIDQVRSGVQARHHVDLDLEIHLVGLDSSARIH